MTAARIRAKQRLGKYRVDRRLSEGGFATVYQAFDTVEGVRVALKIPHLPVVDDELLEDFRKEARLVAQLDHPNVLPLKNATIADGIFVIAQPLGQGSLADRLTKRLSAKLALDYGEQLLRGLAHAHDRGIIHCDIKPENLILFPGDRLRLADFGIAKVAFYTMSASGAGTVGYMAPEQAMGKPTFRSDTFSVGLILYRMLSGELPKWPFNWPPPNYQRVRLKLHPEMVEFLKRSLDMNPRRRFANAGTMLSALQRLKSKALRPPGGGRNRRRKARPQQDWAEVRRRQFLREFKKSLAIQSECARCAGPISETMVACPWCGSQVKTYPGQSRLSRRCKRCRQRTQNRLVLLSLVLWTVSFRDVVSGIQRPTLLRPLLQSVVLAKIADALHAVLSLVSAEGEEEMADRRF